MHAKWVIGIAPWILGGAIVCGLLTCFYGSAPGSFLLWSGGIGIVWVALVALAWRTRSEVLRVCSLIFVVTCQQTLLRRLGDARVLQITQGFLVILVVSTAIMVVFRRWLYKFARLEDNVV